MTWKKLETSEFPMWNFVEKPELEGILVSREEEVGPNKSTIYKANVNGEEFCFWGNTVLDSRLKDVVDGKRIQIKYLGMATSPTTKREYKNFEVYLWEDVVPF